MEKTEKGGAEVEKLSSALFRYGKCVVENVSREVKTGIINILKNP